MSDTQDRRVRRSRRTLWEALLALLHERDWADISVQMICDRADVARSTFYAHFQTKQDLLDEGFAQGAAQLETLAAEGGLVGTLDWLLAHLQSASGFHRRLQGSPAGHAIMTRFRRVIRDRIAQDYIAAGLVPVPEDLNFAVGGVFAVIEAWMSSGCREANASVGEGLRQRIERVIGPAEEL
jgi:AcrR family transcriptional regulator